MSDIEQLREVLSKTISSERRALRADVEHIEIDAKMRNLFDGENLPEDIKDMITELTKIRRRRYLQYLRAFLEEMSYE